MATAIEAALTKTVLALGRDVRGLLLAETPFRDGVLTTSALNLGSGTGAGAGELVASGQASGFGGIRDGNIALRVQGSTTTSARYSIYCYNSSGTAEFSVRNDGRVDVYGDLYIGGSMNITGGYGLIEADIPNLSAAKITAGTFAPARLGAGTASASALLFGDSTWNTLVAADIPSLDAAKITTGTIANARLSGVALTGSANTFSSTQTISGGLNLGSGSGAGAGTIIGSGQANGMGGIGDGNITLRLQGSTTTSARYSLICYNSSSVTELSIRNDGVGYLNAASWTYASDATKKQNIRALNKDIVDFMKLEPKMFDYIEGLPNQYGYIAQDVQLIMPELILTMDDGSLGMMTSSLLPLFGHVLRRLIRVLVNKGVIGPADLA